MSRERPAQKQDEADAAVPPAGGYGDAYVEQPHVLDYVRVIYKRRWLAIATFLAVFVTVVVYTFTATPIYEAQARLLIDLDPNVVEFKQVVDENQARADYSQTQYNLLQSRTLARRTLDAVGGWDKPQFGGTVGKSESGFSVGSVIAAPFTWVAGLFRSSPSPSAEPAGEGETLAQSRAIGALLDSLNIAPIRNSRLADVKFRSSDAALAQQVVNAHLKAYIEQTMEFRFGASKDATDWLSARLTDARADVEKSELALQRYREQNDAISVEGRENIVVQKLGDMNAAVTRAKTERIEKEALYNQLLAVQSSQASLDTFPAIMANTFIQQQKNELARLQQEEGQLAEKLGPQHPDLIKIRLAVQTAQAKLQAEIGKVMQAVRNEFLAAQAQERSLTSALTVQKGETLSMNRKAIELGVLEREVQSARQIYDSLLQRAKETGVSTELRTSNIRVVDEAELPRAPVFPRKLLNLLLAILGGGVLAVGLVFGLEYMDDRVRTPDDIKAHLGLSFLGLVPLIPPKEMNGSAPLLDQGVPANFGEAIRTLRSNLLFSSADEGTRFVCVTSTGPGEGKSLVSANLALALAQSGQRVLLVDADMRRPTQHEQFQQTAEPGLSNFLVGNAKASEVVQKTSSPGLWLLPAGKVPPNPAELLGSKRFKEFLATLPEHFDWVIVDSPPVLPVADSAIVANAVGSVLFVVGAEMASRRAAGAALDQLEASGARLAGAVLNRADVHNHSYYYSQYYRREYANYYQRG